MKRILLICIATVCVAMSSSALRITFNACFNGHWGEWHCMNLESELNSSGGRCFWGQYEEPYNYCFEFAINKRLSDETDTNGTWEVYEGTVTYFVNDEYPTIEAALQNNYNTPKVTPKQTGRPFLKKTVNAEIKKIIKEKQGKYISGYNFLGNPKYKDYTYNVITYNIWFEGIGVGIFLDPSK